ELPPHLAMNLRVVDAAGAELAMSRDLQRLRDELGQAARLTFGSAEPGIERTGIVRWDFGELPEKIAFQRRDRGQTVRLTGYPALGDEGESVAIRLFDTEDAAVASTRAGVRRLLELQLKPQLKTLEKGPPGFTTAALQLRTAIPTNRLLQDLQAAIL